MIKGIIYDLDDLMVNSIPLQVEATEIMLEKFGHSYDELPKELSDSFMGRRIIDILRETIKYFKIDVDLEKFYQERTSIFLKLVEERLQAMPGLEKSLKLFKENGYLIAVASSGARKYIDLVLKRFNIEDYFTFVISGDDVKKGKPDPESYSVASQKLGLATEECLVLEDATNGIEAAKDAGCKCIAVKNINTPVQDHSRADKIISSLEEIDIEAIRLL